MLQEKSFIIQEKVFHYDLNITARDQFTINSVPRNYKVNFLKDDPFNRINALLSENPKNLLLIDEKLLALYQPNLSISADRVFSAPATEEFKGLDGVTRVLDFLQQHQFTKGEKLIVVGGGIIQDVSAFVGAVYKRGISWVLFPSTLLSMCDSCIGAKTGVNYKGAKNQLALFSAPSEININLNFLKTLSESEILSGLGEILKLCVIGGDDFLKIYQAHVINGKVNNFESFRYLIQASLCAKKAVIEEDEFELDHRRSMNYGHTLGHAIEALSNYKIPHGQAVVLGMILVNRLSYEEKLLDEKNFEWLNKLCMNLVTSDVLNIFQTVSLTNIIDLIRKDKKTIGDETSFVFIKRPGNTIFVKRKLDETLYQHIASAFQSLCSIE